MKQEPDPNRQDAAAKGRQSIGRNMLMLGFAAALGLLTWLMQGQLDHMHNPNSNLGSAEGGGVTLARNHYGHYVATGRINGQDVVFLLDTGASNVSVPETVADRLGLRKGKTRRVQTANGSIDVYATTLESVELGPIALDNVAGGINPHIEGEEILLGMSFLKNLDWSQRGDQLTLYPRR